MLESLQIEPLFQTFGGMGDSVIDALRQPLENKQIHIHRQQGDYTFPADFLLIGAMNPCPCGYYPDRNKCNCSITEVRKYISHISGPILDRIDLSVKVSRVDLGDIQNPFGENLSTKDMKAMVDRGIHMQKVRQGTRRNADLDAREIKEFCKLDEVCNDFLNSAYEKFQMSMRGYHKILKIARTIADIDEREKIEVGDLAQAIGYRMDVRENR